MIWLAALLLAATLGIMGVGWFAPALISAIVVAVVAIDSIEANEFTVTAVWRLAIIIAASFIVWGAGRLLRRFLTTVG